MRLAVRSTRHLVTAWMAVVLSASGAARAQSDAAIPESTLREPWVAQLRVIESVPAVDPLPRDALADLESALGEYERQVDRVIDRIVGDPQFAYVADRISRDLALQVSRIHTRFAAVYVALGIVDRPDVRAAQESLERLHDVLSAEKPFEKDVLQALGSASRQQIVGLATRWWNGEERAIAVKQAVGALARAPTP
jgi:hypothetical protein